MIELDTQGEAYKELLPHIKIGRTFFFDESNNIRKGVIGAEKDNNEDLENLYFVLGGIATKKPIDFQGLLNFIDAKQVPKDAKYEFFTLRHKKFTEAIAQRRLRKLFEYLNKENIIVHFAVAHYFHFALIDILDSLIEEKDVNQTVAFSFYKALQSDLTEVLYNDFVTLHRILVDYEFPNIPKNRVNNFLLDILDLYTTNLANYDMGNPESFTKELLRQILEAKKDKTNLVFFRRKRTICNFRFNESNLSSKNVQF